MTKRIISMILALLISMLTYATAFAYEEEIYDGSLSYDIADVMEDSEYENTLDEDAEADTTIPETPEVPEAEIAAPEKADPNEKVANMYICATAKSLSGHVWLYFENTTDHDIQVGYITLAPGKATSVGSLRNSRTDGGGTYYNGEARMANGKSSVKNATISLKEELTASELKKVNSAIKGRNAYNVLWNNCGNFAAFVWNQVSNKKIIHVFLPVFTILEMMIMGGRFGAVDMDNPNLSECYKQVSNGVKQANASSFSMSCV